MNPVLRFDAGGQIACLYTDAIPLGRLGQLHVVRATGIVFNTETQQWDTREATTGKVLFSHPSRQECLRWEHENLQPGQPHFQQPSTLPSTQPPSQT
jgi:hypothetical protein